MTDTRTRIRRTVFPLAGLLLFAVLACGSTNPSVLRKLGEMSDWRDSVTIDSTRYAVPEQWHGLRLGLPGGPDPADLVDLPPELCAPGRKPRLRLEAFLSFRAMADMAAADSIVLRVNSGYRSIETQRQLFRKRMAQGREFEEIAWSVAPPGYSEHMLGNTVDIALGGNYKDNPIYEWLLENAFDYGFYETYPPDPSNVFPWEPWHWRYHTPAERRAREARDEDAELNDN